MCMVHAGMYNVYTRLAHFTDIHILQVPSKLLIQVPRFGREFKTYQKTIPGLSLKLRGLVSSKSAGKQ